MSVMDDPVAYGVRQGGVSYDVVPGIDGELGGDDGGARPVPVLHDLQDVNNTRRNAFPPDGRGLGRKHLLEF